MASRADRGRPRTGLRSVIRSNHRRFWSELLGQGLLFASGVLGITALSKGFYATALVFALAGGWIALLTARGRAADEAEALAAASPPPTASAPEAEARGLKVLLDQAPAPLIALDRSGRLRALNRAARRLFATEELIEAPPQALAEAMSQTDAGDRRRLVLDGAGGPRAYALSLTDLHAGAGPRRLAALIDVQAEMHEAEAEALRKLLQVLSHEIMNSLTPIASLAESAADLLDSGDAGDVAPARDAVATIGRRAEGLAHFVEAYRSLARLPPPRLRSCDLVQIAEDAARLFRTRWRAAGVELSLDVPTTPVIRRADPGLLAQALLSLLTNAAEAAAEGAADSPTVWLSVQDADAGAVMVVRDNGPGVSLPDPEAAFIPFTTTKAGGAGVGLSLARQILRSHGGDIVLAAPQAGEGAELRVSL